MQFRKKPVVIEAIQLTWENWSDICDFVPKPWFVSGCYVNSDGQETTDTSTRLGLKMRTLESQEFIAVEGDWIIKGTKGEYYPCKPDIFIDIYEAV